MYLYTAPFSRYIPIPSRYNPDTFQKCIRHVSECSRICLFTFDFLWSQKPLHRIARRMGDLLNARRPSWWHVDEKIALVPAVGGCPLHLFPAVGGCPPHYFPVCKHFFEKMRKHTKKVKNEIRTKNGDFFQTTRFQTLQEIRNLYLTYYLRCNYFDPKSNNT